MEDIDVFPCEVIHKMEDWIPLERPTETDMENSFPFICYLPVAGGTRMRYQEVPQRKTALTNMAYTLDNLSTVHPQDTRWGPVDKRHRKDPLRAKKGKREDVTLSFRWSNAFLTKKMFTFGVRNVEKGTVHLYQTLDAPMLIYLPKPNLARQRKDRTFDYTMDKSYVPHLMPPHAVAAIRSSHYVLLTTGKTIFAVDVCTPQLVSDIEKEVRIRQLRPLVQKQTSPPPPPQSAEQSVLPVAQFIKWKRDGVMVRSPTKRSAFQSKEQQPDRPATFLAPQQKLERRSKKHHRSATFLAPRQLERPPRQLESPPQQFESPPQHFERPPQQFEPSPQHLERPHEQLEPSQKNLQLLEELQRCCTAEQPEDRLPEQLQEALPERLPEQLQEELPERLQEQLQEVLPEQLQERLPEQLQEELPVQIPEELPVPSSEQPSSAQPSFDTIDFDCLDWASVQSYPEISFDFDVMDWGIS